MSTFWIRRSGDFPIPSGEDARANIERICRQFVLEPAVGGDGVANGGAHDHNTEGESNIDADSKPQSSRTRGPDDHEADDEGCAPLDDAVRHRQGVEMEGPPVRSASLTAGHPGQSCRSYGIRLLGLDGEVLEALLKGRCPLGRQPRYGHVCPA